MLLLTLLHTPPPSVPVFGRRRFHLSSVQQKSYFCKNLNFHHGIYLYFYVIVSQPWYRRSHIREPSERPFKPQSSRFWVHPAPDIVDFAILHLSLNSIFPYLVVNSHLVINPLRRVKHGTCYFEGGRSPVQSICVWELTLVQIKEFARFQHCETGCCNLVLGSQKEL